MVYKPTFTSLGGPSCTIPNISIAIPAPNLRFADPDPPCEGHQTSSQKIDSPVVSWISEEKMEKSKDPNSKSWWQSLVHGWLIPLTNVISLVISAICRLNPLNKAGVN